MGSHIDALSEPIRSRKRSALLAPALAAIIAAVLLIAAYAFVLPAQTMDKNTYCGHTAHTHADACYEAVLTCGLEESNGEGDTSGSSGDSADAGNSAAPTSHTHTDACYEAQTTLTCGLAESEGHTHADTCYESVLVCTDTSEGHQHTDACFEQQLTCTLEESAGHTHADACYTTTQVLTCGLEESNGEGDGEGDAAGAAAGAASTSATPTHTHTDACYTLQLACELEEHTHTLACYSNPNADLETAADWEASLPAAEQLTGIWADDLLLVAKSQLGYTESTDNYQVLEDGTTTKGYTRYGAWYGNPYGDWCAMFVSFCLHYAGIPTEAMPQNASCQNWIDALSDEDTFAYYIEASPDFTPLPGDLIFFDWDADGASDHVGIVSEVLANDAGEITQIKTIEGNASNAVALREYEPADATIMGYATLPTNPDAQMLSDGTGADETDSPAYVLEDGAYFFAAKDDTSLPRYYQCSAYKAGYATHPFVLIPCDELEDGAWEPSTTNWNGKANANYIVAYCSDDRTTTSPSDSDLYDSFTIDNSRFTTDEQQRKMAAIIGNSYPFLTADEARAVMVKAGVEGASAMDEHELITAAQWAVWATIETVSHISSVSDVSDESWNSYLEQTLNPLTPPAVKIADSPVDENEKTAQQRRIIAAKNWLCSLIDPIELEVAYYTPIVMPNTDGTSDLGVAVTLNREIVAGENASFSMTAGSKSTEISQLASGEDTFSVWLRNLTDAELSDARVNLSVAGEHMQAYFFDSQHWQDMVGGSWEAYENDLSFDIGLEKIDVAVTKTWAGSSDTSSTPSSVQVQLYANGSPLGQPVTLSAANNWHYTWEGLNRYSVTELNKPAAERACIDYTVVEIPAEGYYSSVTTVSSYEEIDTVPQWQEVSTFDGEGKYVLVSDTGALSAEYVDPMPEDWSVQHFISLRPIDLTSGSSVDESAIWNITEADTGHYIESAKYPGYYLQGYWWGTELSSTPTEMFFDDGLLHYSYGNRELYFGGFWADGSQYFGDKSTAMPLKLYKLVDLELPAADVNFIITNTELSTIASADSLTNISVTKAWEGRADNAYPESVQVQLMQLDVFSNEMTPYGTPITLSAANNWTHTWADMPTAITQGSKTLAVDYAILEVELPEGYTSTCAEDPENAWSFTLTNTWQGNNETDEGDSTEEGDESDDGSGGGSGDSSDSDSSDKSDKREDIARTGDPRWPIITLLVMALASLAAATYAHANRANHANRKEMN